MSDYLRFVFCIALSWMASTLNMPNVQADPTRCLPTRGYLSTSVQPISDDDSKKLSRKEFGPLPILPAGSALLPKGTELNVVVDTTCLVDLVRGPVELPWLKDLKAKVRVSQTSSLRSFHYQLERDWEFEKLQTLFESEPCVSLVSPERKYFTSALANDPLIPEQTHLKTMRFHEAIDGFLVPLMARFHPVTIAIIDTGVDFNHPDLKLNRWINKREIPGNGKDDDRNGYVDDVDGYNFPSDRPESGPEGDWPENRHGTHVAGLAGARLDNNIGGSGIHGVAKIMSLNVFGRNGYTRSSVLENAIRYAADEGATIINMSLGGREYSRTMRSVLEYAISKGSFIVTAAGNDGIELCEDPSSFDFISPAVYGSTLDGMMVTGSLDSLSGTFSHFSNFSRRLVEIAAPGAYSSSGQLIGLLSTTPKNSYGYLAGTSMAAPILSGTAALVYSWLKTYLYPVSPQTIEKVLKAGAKSDGTLTTRIQGGRSLDLVTLLSYLQSQYPMRTPGGETQTGLRTISINQDQIHWQE